MTPQQLRRTSRMLSAMSSDSRPCRFLMSPDGVRGPVLILDRQQIGASVKLRLMRDGVHRFAEGTVRRGDDGSFEFTSRALNAKKLKVITRKLTGDLPMLENARLAS